MRTAMPCQVGRPGSDIPLRAYYRPYWVYLPHISGRTDRNPET